MVIITKVRFDVVLVVVSKQSVNGEPPFTLCIVPHISSHRLTCDRSTGPLSQNSTHIYKHDTEPEAEAAGRNKQTDSRQTHEKCERQENASTAVGASISRSPCSRIPTEPSLGHNNTDTGPAPDLLVNWTAAIVITAQTYQQHETRHLI